MFTQTTVLSKAKIEIIENFVQRRTEETAEMYAEKSRVKEEEVMLTQHKAHTFQREMERLRENARETEKEKVSVISPPPRFEASNTSINQ